LNKNDAIFGETLLSLALFCHAAYILYHLRKQEGEASGIEPAVNILLASPVQNGAKGRVDTLHCVFIINRKFQIEKYKMKHLVCYRCLQ